MQEENPYQSPLEDCSRPPAIEAKSSPLASETARFVNLLLDGIAIHLIIYLVRVTPVLAHWYPSRELVPFPSFCRVSSVSCYADRFAGSLYCRSASACDNRDTALLLPFESFWARTPAKFVTRTKVVTVDFGPPTLAHIFLRSVFRLIPFEAISFMECNPVGWHDRFSNTRVIKDR